MLFTGFDIDEPNTVQDVLSGQSTTTVGAAMDRELGSLQIKETWQEVKGPQGRA